jgi:hypothetical protein
MISAGKRSAEDADIKVVERLHSTSAGIYPTKRIRPLAGERKREGEKGERVQKDQEGNDKREQKAMHTFILRRSPYDLHDPDRHDLHGRPDDVSFLLFHTAGLLLVWILDFGFGLGIRPVPNFFFRRHRLASRPAERAFFFNGWEHTGPAFQPLLLARALPSEATLVGRTYPFSSVSTVWLS